MEWVLEARKKKKREKINLVSEFVSRVTHEVTRKWNPHTDRHRSFRSSGPLHLISFFEHRMLLFLILIPHLYCCLALNLCNSCLCDVRFLFPFPRSLDKRTLAPFSSFFFCSSQAKREGRKSRHKEGEQLNPVARRSIGASDGMKWKNGKEEKNKKLTVLVVMSPNLHELDWS